MATVNNYNGNKDIETMIKIFRRECENEQILSELKKRKYFTKSSRLNHLAEKKREHRAKVNAKNKNKYKNKTY